MKLLLSQLVVVRHFLLRWAPAGTWLAIAAWVVVALWGWIDPFGLRQRLDWIVSDQFLRARHAPEMHPDIVLIAMDDGSVEKMGFPIPRSDLAGVLHQLQKLEARTVLVDILFIEPQKNYVLDEAEAWLLPRGSVIARSELRSRVEDAKQLFSQDQILARALRENEQLVIPFQFLSKDSAARTFEQGQVARDQLLQRMAEALLGKPDLAPAELAAQVGAETDLVRDQFESALNAAMDRLARQQLQQRASAIVEDAIQSTLPPEHWQSYLAAALRRAFDRASAEQVVVDRASIPLPAGQKIRSSVATSEIKLPRHQFADASRAVGFADMKLDADGTLRRLPLYAPWQQRIVFHQALAGALLHRSVSLEALRFDRASLRSDSGEIQLPVDSQARLTINWPMDRRRRWDRKDVIHSIPLGVFYELNRYESDLRRHHHDRRELLKEMGKIVAKEPDWELKFQEILNAQRQGQFEAARNLEDAFDAEVIGQILKLPVVVEALEQARTTPAPALDVEDSEPPVLAHARAVVEKEEEIEVLAPEYESVLDDLRPRIRGKLCLVGDTTTGSTDLKRTPVDEAMPGVAVIAASLSTMLTGMHLTVYGYGMSLVVFLVLGGCLIGPFLRLRAATAGASALAAVGTVLFGSYFLLAAASVSISPVVSLIGLPAIYLTTTTYQWLNEYRQKQLVRTIFEAQTNATIVERLIEAGQAGVEEVLTPKNRQVTLLFAEIADFQELAQQVPPERLPELLSRTFGTMDKVIKANEGTLDRYQGHALVAFFGAPIYQPDHAQRACRTALECCDTIRAFKSAWLERGLPVPRVHIGLHTGELLVGNITLTTRVDYTIAGENLNVAYRIGELNETYGTEVMISEATLSRCENMVEARELDLVRIKGRREPVRSFELMSAKGQLKPEQLQLRGAFATALTAFRNRDYANALSMFRTCRETSPGDRPATVYIERCEKELGATVQVEELRPAGE
jgi:class 3 adenylate cyclase/CHASE2 domain-containing sensor protein